MDRERRLNMTKLKIEQIDSYSCFINDDIIQLRGMGGCRRKCFYDNYIIKFEETDIVFSDEPDQNEREIHLWNNMDKKDRKYFPKMIQYSKKDGYIVQERIRFQRGRKATKHRDVVYDLVKKYRIGDIAFSGDNDNWGVRADTKQPVIYDYGYLFF